MLHRDLLSAGVACAVLTIIAPTSAVAADAGDASSPSSEGSLEAIVVTAQRRGENLQNVPIAVTAVTASALDQAGIQDQLALQEMVPGFTLIDDAGYSQAFLRGVGTTTTGPSYEPSVATYIDGVYIGSGVTNMFAYNNIAQVEVLKGPQGTLFGRNATGGVINITTRTPSQTPSVDASVTYANYGTIESQVYATGGITDNLAADFAVTTRHQGDGWGYDPVTQQQIYWTDDLSARSKWVYTPTDSTRLTLTFDHLESRTDVGQDLTFLPGAVGLDGATRYAGFYTSFAQHEDYVNISSSSVSLKAEQGLGFARLVSISAYQESAFRTRFDQDSTPLNVVDAFWHQPAESFSEELQLLSPESSKVQWIGGLFYFDQRTAFPFHLAGLAAYPFDVLTIDYDDRLTSMAAFGQGTVEILPDTHLTAGLRYTTDRHDVTGATYGDSLLLASATPSAKFDKLTWRFVLDHQFTPDVLGYISDNRGFKAGGFNQQQYTLPPVKPEVLDAYEAGLNTQFLDRRLRVNLAGYDYNYKDVQVNVYPAGSLEVINGAAAQIYGVDGDVAGALTNNFTLQTGVSWIHGRYTNFPDCPSYVPTAAGGNTQITINCTGHTTAHSPGFTGDIGAEYRTPTSVGELSYNLTFSYSTGYYPDPDNRIRQPHTTLVHPSVLWKSLDKKLDVRVWADNLLNEHYYQFLTAQATGDIGSPSAPRTYGVTVGVHF